MAIGRGGQGGRRAEEVAEGDAKGTGRGRAKGTLGCGLAAGGRVDESGAHSKPKAIQGLKSTCCDNSSALYWISASAVKASPADCCPSRYAGPSSSTGANADRAGAPRRCWSGAPRR